MMAWGKECGSWDTSVDIANLEKFDFNEVPEDHFVTTTWHDDEPLSVIFWFSKHNACHSTQEIEYTIVFHLSKTCKKDEITSEYSNA